MLIRICTRFGLDFRQIPAYSQLRQQQSAQGESQLAARGHAGVLRASARARRASPNISKASFIT